MCSRCVESYTHKEKLHQEVKAPFPLLGKVGLLPKFKVKLQQDLEPLLRQCALFLGCALLSHPQPQLWGRIIHLQNAVTLIASPPVSW